MRPGIIIQHGALPERARDAVRGDVAAILGLVPEGRWPEGAAASDFFEVVLRRAEDLSRHPHAERLDPAARRAVRSFFENGGDVLFVYGVCVVSDDSLGDLADSDGPLGPVLDRLSCEDDIALLACPAAAWMRCEVRRTGEVVSDADPLYSLLLDHCRTMANRFAILDAPRGLGGHLLTRWVEGFRDRIHQRARLTRDGPDPLSFGAVYWPWLKRGDEVLPPSGPMMGLFARVEREHAPFGIAWPPANVLLAGVTHTEVELTWDEAGALAESGVNPILVQTGRGVVVWGARTLSTDPAHIHINTRRVIGLIKEQLRRDNEWAVFEVNDPSLWKVIERNVLVRLDQFYEAGLIAGPRSRAEYSVLCDQATNPAVRRDRGELNVAIRLRPVGTIEHVHIDLQLGGEHG